ncbi:hypothetical protein MPSEU_000551000 [Mayamaea pseudoterrestris]|nr:hypothetical protein MPSEU_000551000 [Mayamaea pseudoterrestris]
MTTTISNNDAKSLPAAETIKFPLLPLLCLDDSAKQVTTHDLLQADTWTVIDFWTTKCTRCPAALDALNARAKIMAEAAATKQTESETLLFNDDDFNMDMDFDNNTSNQSSSPATNPYHKTNMFSICCGNSSDVARSLIEQGDVGENRWPHVVHYYMDVDSKETAKRVLKFTQVPFYVILNANGCIVQMGNKNIDWNVLLLVRDESTSVTKNEPTVVQDAFVTQEQTQQVPAISIDKNETVIDSVDTSSKLADAVDSATDGDSPTSVKEPVFCLDDMDF